MHKQDRFIQTLINQVLPSISEQKVTKQAEMWGQLYLVTEREEISTANMD